jgi:hypothetical protein
VSAPTAEDYAAVVAEMQRELVAGNYPRVKALAGILPDRRAEVPDLFLSGTFDDGTFFNNAPEKV